MTSPSTALTPTPFLTLLARAFTHAVLLCGVLAAATIAGQVTDPGASGLPAATARTTGLQGGRAGAVTDAARIGVRIARRHPCWGEPVDRPQPVDMAGRLPGHAVLQVGGSVRYTGSTRLVGLALEDALGEPQPDVTVYAFCR